MKRLRIITWVATAAALLATAGIALASAQFTQTSSITLTATKAGGASGFKAALKSADPGAPNAQPQALKTLTITFPKGTKFNFKSKAITQCKASATELVGTKGSACPAKSKIGTGSAAVNGAPVFPLIPENVTAFAGANQIVFFLTPKGASGETLPLYGKVSANKVTTEVPELKKSGLTFVITELQLVVKKLGSGKNAFVTAGKCSKGKFTVKADFLYQTGEKLTRTSSSACKP